MAEAKRNATDTKQRLLKAAGEAFAEKGYREATVAEICERADANIAAVNYHFRSKENLYVAAWRAAFEASLSKHPPDGGLDDDAPAAERLRARMGSLLRRFLDADTREFDIMHRELDDPTGLLDEAFRKAIEPMRRSMFGTLRALLGPRASNAQVLLGVLSVIGPILHTAHRIRYGRSPRRRRPPGPNPEKLLAGGPEAVIDHMVRFVLAGLERMREGIDAGDWPDVELPEEAAGNHPELLGDQA